ncbi:MAG TPA: SBBP repeat-containing protein, partial [Aggregatilineales bacterium]|nr:SBBP repeat-containing protein [Aggregatilineales bacterium]
MPLYFEENRGQVDPDIRFISRGSGYTLFLTSEEAVLNLQSGEAENQVHSLRMRLIDANPAPEIRAEDRIPGGTSYFIGSDPSKWYTDAAHYERVRWREVYPGIDLVYYGSQTQLQYDFIIAPGANPDHIRMHFSGLDDITITPEGDLLLQVEGGILRQQAPFTYQEIDGQRVEVSSRFIVNDTETVTFEVGAYNPIYPLVIDPALLYSTYLGGTGSDFPYQIAAGSNGNVYITGLTQSVDFRPLNAYDSTHNGSRDVFVTRLDTNQTRGGAYIYSTFLGGAGDDIGYNIEVDSSGIVYVIGDTRSSDFPLVNAFDNTLVGFVDGFISKIDTTKSGTTSLLFSSYLGGGS